MSIWHTQRVYNALIPILSLHPEAKQARCALVEVTLINGVVETVAARLRKSRVGVWEIVRLYRADKHLPGDVGVVVVGVWDAPKCTRKAHV